jgi:DNA ligase-1
MNLAMTSDQIMATIDSIAATSGKNDKVSMIAACSGSEDFVRVLKSAIDPTVTYGVAKRPALIGENCGSQFDTGTWALISDLANRSLTGNAAIEAIAGEMTALTAQSSELFWRIISKDLKAGFGDSSVNKAIKGLIPEFPYMRCSLPKEAKLEEFDWELGVFSQEKADGMYFNVDVDAVGNVAMSSRQGSQFPLDEMQDIVDVISGSFPFSTRVNGEVEVERDDTILPREIGNGIMNHIQDGGKFGPGERPILKLWDAMPLTAAQPKGKYNVKYVRRFSDLRKALGGYSKECCVRVIDTRIVHSLQEAYEHYAELLELGKEGTVVKDPHGVWADTTSKHQVKLKLEFEVDLKIIGFEPGKGKNESTFGSIITETDEGLLRVNVSGFKDKPGIGYMTRAEIWAKKDELLNTIMTVRANGIMKPSVEGKLHSLFLPRSVEFRRDKHVADSLQRVFDQYEDAIKNAAIKAEALKKAA